MSNNYEAVRDTRNMSKHHEYETGDALSDSVNKTFVNCTLAKKSRWRYIRLAKKPRYLGNHASHIRSYYGSLSRSHGRPFGIRHEILPEAPPSEEITMTSYPVGNRTSLTWKPCIADKKLLGITIMKIWSVSNFYKKQQIWIQKTYQFMNFINGVSRSHTTASMFFTFDSV